MGCCAAPPDSLPRQSAVAGSRAHRASAQPLLTPSRTPSPRRARWAARHLPADLAVAELREAQAAARRHVSDHCALHYRQFLLDHCATALADAADVRLPPSTDAVDARLPPSTDAADARPSPEGGDDRLPALPDSRAALRALWGREMAAAVALIEEFAGHEALWAHRRALFHIWAHRIDPGRAPRARTFRALARSSAHQTARPVPEFRSLP